MIRKLAKRIKNVHILIQTCWNNKSWIYCVQKLWNFGFLCRSFESQIRSLIVSVYLISSFISDLRVIFCAASNWSARPKKTQAYLILLPRTSSWKNKSYQNSVRQVEIDRSRSDMPFLFPSIGPVPFDRLRAFDESLAFSSTYRERYSDSKRKLYIINNDPSEIGTVI